MPSVRSNRPPPDVELEEESLRWIEDDEVRLSDGLRVRLLLARKVLFRADETERATDGETEGVVLIDVRDRIDMASASLGLNRLYDLVSDPPH